MEFLIFAINTLIVILIIILIFIHLISSLMFEYLNYILKLRYNCQYRIITETQYEFMLINDSIQKLNSIRVRLRMTQKKGRNM
jgi:hypothetical protein